VKGQDLKRLRERNNWSQSDLANAINAALGRSYGTGSISPWENDKRNIPADVAAFCDQLMIETNLSSSGDAAGSSSTPPDGEPRTLDDSAPGPGGAVPPPQPTLLSPTGGTYAKACEELWEIIGAGVGMVGGAVNSDVLMIDGQIIVMDKRALGEAWGRLAETNETFRRFLAGALEGGTWIQVALVTGSTLAKVQQNHAEYRLAARAATNGHVEGFAHGEPAEH
jgi:hypothetical protein